MLELAFAIMRPAMPCWDEELHLLHLEKWLKDRVFPRGDLEGTSDVIHQCLLIAKQLQEKTENRKGIFGPARVLRTMR